MCAPTIFHPHLSHYGWTSNCLILRPLL
uniref:Uncharacterized protein n=1 Tax=Anguilla anguilla TaxID=7936 RepID=A0A0E9RFH0_ANGAN